MEQVDSYYMCRGKKSDSHSGWGQWRSAHLQYIQPVETCVQSATLTSQERNSGSKSYCWCVGTDKVKWIACDSETCPRQWLHVECFGLTCKVRGKWFCSDDCCFLNVISNAS